MDATRNNSTVSALPDKEKDEFRAGSSTSGSENGESGSESAAVAAPPKPSFRTARDLPLWRKVSIVVFVAVFAFLSTFAASVIAPGREQLERDFHISRTAAILPVSVFNIGMAAGPVLGSPVSESIGRQPVYVTSMPLLLIFTLGAGFSKDLGSLLVCRFFSGVCASTGVTLASATIADLFAKGDARRYAIYAYYSMPWLGACLGPLVGSLVVASLTWEWTLWVYLMIAAPVVVPGLLFMPETKLSVLQTRAETPTSELFSPRRLMAQAKVGMKSIPAFLRRSIIRPLHMLFTELIVTLICLYAGFSFGLIYALVVALPDIYQKAYGFNYTQQGLSFLPLIGGVIAGPVSLIVYSSIASKTSKKDVDVEKASEPQAPPTPESRLHGAMVGGVMLPCALIWFSWTARSDVYFLCPMIASIFITWGSRMVYVSNSAYMTDVYGPVYAASAQAASTFVRYSMAAGIPLFVLQMYDALGIGWASSVISLAAFLMMPIPFIFYRFGPQLRARCKYQTEA